MRNIMKELDKNNYTLTQEEFIKIGKGSKAYYINDKEEIKELLFTGVEEENRTISKECIEINKGRYSEFDWMSREDLFESELKAVLYLRAFHQSKELNLLRREKELERKQQY